MQKWKITGFHEIEIVTMQLHISTTNTNYATQIATVVIVRT